MKPPNAINSLPFGRILPLERAVSWLFVAAGFAFMTLMGVLTGLTNLAMCAYISIFGGVEIYRMLRFLAALHEERKLCTADYQALQQTASTATRSIVGNLPASVLRKVVTASAHAQSRGSIGGIQPLLEGFRADFAAITDRCRSAADILATMGLLGTIVGLLEMFTKFEIALSAADASQISEGIRGSLAGLSTAFYTTLFGSFLGNFVLRGLADIADEVIDRLLSQLSAQSIFIVLNTSRQDDADRSTSTMSGRRF